MVSEITHDEIACNRLSVENARPIAYVAILFNTVRHSFDAPGVLNR